ncbi:MAG TPA: TonB family protein [Candidatus Sumerlaeota bacterium]|nr:MAG: Filamentous hemagglutinin [candidate division BRC1 bacterium ADurb.Bin183]HOE62603.1 TonB family protein [Candidatus Sumerlaeota bacterium]HRR30943.1 TonB family protein [Candidatus Sumerlaeia bacterium]HON49363.1 TonB family protein [Candidatus Sumerlaeota bacterium]HOR64889.1 TonB family protein [Candidatus Sumerlaeota bacterium]
MNKTIIFSLIFHIAVAAAFLILSAIQVKFIRLKPANAMQVKFVNPPPKDEKPKHVMTPAPPKEPVKTPAPQVKKEEPKPEPPKPEPPKPKQEPKPEPKPEPKKVIEKPTEKKVPKEPPAPKKTPSPSTAPARTPPPARTPWPPLPSQPSFHPRPQQTARQAPAPQPNVPVADQLPLKITASDKIPNYYLLMAQQKIEGNFKLMRSQRYEGIYCAVEFRVDREGRIYDIRVVRSTGQRDLDKFALEAVEQTGFLGPLPDSFKESSITILANFDYSP